MEGHAPHNLENFPIYVGSWESFVHYTCNSPKSEVLEKYGIEEIGDSFGCKDSREVLKIPLSVYEQLGFQKTDNLDVVNINLENLMKRLN